MELIRIKNPNEKYFAECMAIYENSFPLVERRENSEQVKALKDDDFNFCAVVDNGKLLGTAIYWETDDFIYWEYLCIEEKLRNRTFGTQVSKMMASKGKMIIFEVELPVDDISRRRIGFWQRCGFCLNEQIEHIQLPYRKGDELIKMMLVSYGRKITPQEYEKFYNYAKTKVVAV